jgi:hypothetical protein
MLIEGGKTGLEKLKLSKKANYPQEEECLQGLKKGFNNKRINSSKKK